MISGDDIETPTRQIITFTVPAARLAWGIYDHKKEREGGQGDIHASYSADTIATENRVRKPFRFGADLWINTGMSGCGGIWETEAYRLVSEKLFSGHITNYHDRTNAADDAEAARNDPNGFYHGMMVKCGKEMFVLSGPLRFSCPQKNPKDRAAKPPNPSS